MKGAVWKSWLAKAESDPDAADKVRRYQQRPGEELYDITKDKYEWNNLADDPAYVEIKADLRQRLLAWMKAMGDEGQKTEMEALEHVNKNTRLKFIERLKNK